jgi:hypothetical protein
MDCYRLPQNIRPELGAVNLLRWLTIGLHDDQDGGELGDTERYPTKVIQSFGILNWVRQNMARPERFELPTFWFVAVAARRINNLE